MFWQDEKETIVDIGRNVDHHCYIKFTIGWNHVLCDILPVAKM